jgi:hypothetical protein
MQSGQVGKYGSQSAVKRSSRALVILVPRRECGHH